MFWKTNKDQCSILGAISAPLLSDSISSFGFASIPQLIQSRLTIPPVDTSTNPRYTPWSFDTMANLAAKNGHTNIILHQGLTAASDEYGGLEFCKKTDSYLIESIYSKQLVKIFVPRKGITK